jgi:hypothetical protein
MSEEVMAEVVTDRHLPATTSRLGAHELATIPDDEFNQRLAALQKSQARVRQIKASLMTADVHYGVIPGTGDKPTLLKPGAELLCSVYGLRPDFVPQVVHGDGGSAPDIEVTMRCELHLGDMAGPIVAVGYGMANSWERKHRYRRGERTCPKCGVVGSVIKGKAEFGGGWLCWPKKGGCNTKFDDDAEVITSQTVGDVENPDPHDLANTLIKMAKKRAFLDATLTGTASSDVFTQDLEETAPEEKPKAEKPKRGRKEEKPPSQVKTCKFCDSPNIKLDTGGESWHCQDCNKGGPVGH